MQEMETKRGPNNMLPREEPWKKDMGENVNLGSYPREERKSHLMVRELGCWPSTAGLLLGQEEAGKGLVVPSRRDYLFLVVVIQSLSCVWLCDPMDCNMPGFPVLHHLLEFAQTHVHWVSDAIQPSHPLLSPSPALTLCHHQGLFQWISSLHCVAKVLELQLQHQSFQWIFSVDFL